MSAAIQLPLDLGAIPSTPATRDASPPTIELNVVVCHVCTGRHPVERCPARLACGICSGPHHALDHHWPTRTTEARLTMVDGRYRSAG